MTGDGGCEATLAALAGHLTRRGWRLAAAESCTGGWIGKLCTDCDGSSAWFEASVVAYANSVKRTLLGVSGDTLARCGAVSREAVLEMVAGVFECVTEADVAVAVSGVAGPTGGTPGTPVGTVWFAWCARGAEPEARRMHFEGDRERVRRVAARFALAGLLEYLE